ncbi:hypothetical protein RQP46_003989 [Phenoliferia psychrophenolica]
MPPKRIIACCDGTWVNGLTEENKSGYTNVLRIARALEHHDARSGGDDPISQIVYYGSGVGSDPGLASIGQGMTGDGLVTKVEEAYAFLASNYVPGDEIFLFGFSRGAYTARMVAGIVGEIGLLDKVQMELWPTLFVELQTEGSADKDDKPEKLTEAAELLATYRAHAKAQIEAAGGFLIKAVGVFDTVGAMGLPSELHSKQPEVASLFGFSNTGLGPHIELALHALAIDETRKDFRPTLWVQTQAGQAKGQVLKQVWFSDIGGGWDEHDASDITLAWMVSETAHVLAFDPKYIESIPDPTAAYGKQPPHNPEVGMFSFAFSYERPPPTITGFPTHETIHHTVPLQAKLTKAVTAALEANPGLVHPLSGFEIVFEKAWTFEADKPRRAKPKTLASVAHTGAATQTKSKSVTIGKRTAAVKVRPDVKDVEVKVVTRRKSFFGGGGTPASPHVVGKPLPARPVLQEVQVVTKKKSFFSIRK